MPFFSTTYLLHHWAQHGQLKNAMLLARLRFTFVTCPVHVTRANSGSDSKPTKPSGLPKTEPSSTEGLPMGSMLQPHTGQSAPRVTFQLSPIIWVHSPHLCWENAFGITDSNARVEATKNKPLWAKSGNAWCAPTIGPLPRATQLNPCIGCMYSSRGVGSSRFVASHSVCNLLAVHEALTTPAPASYACIDSC